MSQTPLRKLQGQMIFHGALVVAVGLVCGFFLMFELLGEVAIWPVPGIDAEIPGSVRGWQAAHVGGILNGVMILACAACMPLLTFTARARQGVAWALIFTGWANTVFYLFGNLAPNRGLSGGTNALGEGNWAGLVAYVPAAIATVVTLSAMLVIARAGLELSRDRRE
jgi:styrene-oxide isomerase